MGVRFAERRGARPAQVDQVRADAERIADVRAQGANVGAGFAPHPEEDVPAIDLERLELVDVPGSLLPLDGRPDRRGLIDLPDEPAHHGPDAPLVDVLVELHHAKYSLSPSRTASSARVASARATGRTPVTRGSRVPEWPAFGTPNMSRTQALT